MTVPDHANNGRRSGTDIAELLAELRPQAIADGISAATFETLTHDLAIVAKVTELSTAQPEHERSTGDYIAALVSEERIAAGRDHLSRRKQMLADITSKFGVPAEVLVAIWGIESNFGAAIGSRPVIPSLVTLAVTQERRRRFWCEQLLAAMHIVQAGDIIAERLVGSWAGAMGHTQFMPTTFRDYAIDFDGDGRRDIWDSISDALASAANYLKASGWQADRPWGTEVTLDTTFDFAASGDDDWQPLQQWQRRGANLALPTTGACALVPDTPLQLRLPAGAKGPAFLVSENFHAILSYNAAIFYALAVAHLSDRIAGVSAITTAWPDEPPLTRPERIELQQLLVAGGYDTGGVDGILGRASRRAIRDYQLRCRLCPDGFHSRHVLDHLRRT